MPRVRVHQHVNPFSPYYLQEPQPVDVKKIFADPSLPLHLDIGSARGRFILRMAETRAPWNYLGIEIREPLVIEANAIARDKGLANIHYEFCNAMRWLGRLLSQMPDGLLQKVTVQFPDPWFKKKHAKRRMVNGEMIDTIAKYLSPNGRVFVQTDIEFLADEMFDLFRADERFTEIAITANPFPVKTEREKAVEDKNLPIYRTEFIRNKRSDL